MRRLHTRGVLIEPAKTVAWEPQPYCHAVGDSIRAGLAECRRRGCATCSLTNQPAYKVVNWGFAGVTMKAIDTGRSRTARRRNVHQSGGVRQLFLQAGMTSRFCLGRRRRSVFSMRLLSRKMVKQAGCRSYIVTGFSKWNRCERKRLRH